MNETALLVNKKKTPEAGKNELYSRPSHDVHRTDSTTSTDQAHKLQIPGTEYTANKICPSK
jgi:hypothetical protein